MDDDEVDIFNTSGDSIDLNLYNSSVTTPDSALTPTGPETHSPREDDCTDGVIFSQLNFTPLESVQEPPEFSPLQSDAASPKEMSFEVLQYEVAKLHVLLNQSRSENHRAAQAGLELLEEKENIQREYSIVLEECSRLKNDLKTTQAVSAMFLMMTCNLLMSINFIKLSAAFFAIVGIVFPRFLHVMSLRVFVSSIDDIMCLFSQFL